MNNQVKTNLLFYSNKCRDCYTFINLMKNEGMIQYFKMICVDNNIKDIPKCITQVPALISADQNKLFMGEEVFAWLQRMKYIRQQQILNERTRELYSIICIKICNLK